MSLGLVLVACGGVSSVDDDADAAVLVDGAVPGCGNSIVETGEDCDDGNTAFGDGCSASCLEEDVCVITHNGGTPLSVSTVKIDRAGGSTLVATQSLGGNDDASLLDVRQAITACGTHV